MGESRPKPPRPENAHAMSRIQLLPEEVASQVAAGEVVERPASVIKELVENSLDAGAARIEIAARRGGASMIRVVDDGSGMDRDDALLCLERHATSKIRTGLDLASVSTLGFRGEALPSIASVSRFRLATREHGAVGGTEIVVNGGRIEAVRDSGEAPGTQIEVRSLFYNLPARRKFLRSEATEASHIEHQVHLQAIGHPGVGFALLLDDRLAFQLAPAASLAERVRDLLGDKLVGDLIELPGFDTGGVHVRGLIGKPGVSRSTRQQQIVFVNGRAVENPALNHGLREGYHTALMKGQFPITYLFLDIDPGQVDVNVHPAKREVRFRNPAAIREAVAQAVRITLESGRAAWARSFLPAPAPASPFAVPTESAQSPGIPEPLPLIPPAQQHVLRNDWAEFPRTSPAPGSPAPPETPPSPASVESLPLPGRPAPAVDAPTGFRIIGVLGRLYILLENAQGLVLVDQHAAHERILFEQMRRQMETGGVPGQRLLMPATLQLPPRDFDWVRSRIPDLHKMGIGIEEFGPGTLKIDTLPEYLIGGDPGQLVRDLIEELRGMDSATSRLRLGEDLIATTVCRHAVKAHDLLRGPELVRLIEDLLACDLPYCCPHGRPTMIQISHGELERKFGRVV